MCPRLFDTDRESYKEVVRELRKALKPFVAEMGPETRVKIEEACHRALKRLGDTVPEFRRMVPVYEINCDQEDGSLLCSFYMDVPYVEARVTLHRPPTLTEEEWNELVDEIVADLTPQP
jgi:hypothetical protein